MLSYFLTWLILTTMNLKVRLVYSQQGVSYLISNAQSTSKVISGEIQVIKRQEQSRKQIAVCNTESRFAFYTTAQCFCSCVVSCSCSSSFVSLCVCVRVCVRACVRCWWCWCCCWCFCFAVVVCVFMFFCFVFVLFLKVYDK